MLLTLVAVELPEKQGLKLLVCSGKFINFIVAVELPEKQGLKQEYRINKDDLSLVAVELPEKQGLKRNATTIKSIADCRCSGTSRKTRIET